MHPRTPSVRSCHAPRHHGRATIRRMELRLGSHVFSIGDFVIYVADADVAARTAGIAEIEAHPDLVARTRLDHPGLPLAVAASAPAVARACVEAGAELLVGDHLAEVAAATGAGLVCS